LASDRAKSGLLIVGLVGQSASGTLHDLHTGRTISRDAHRHGNSLEEALRRAPCGFRLQAKDPAVCRPGAPRNLFVTSPHPIPDDLVERLHRQAHAERWSVTVPRFAVALQTSADRAAAGVKAGTKAFPLERYLKALHLEDLALACACAAGHEGAWDHFVREYRPSLYRAADALDPSGRARELADSLYADLYGTAEHDGERRSLFRYFHGRSSLPTWLRAVLAQRHVDAIRARRRHDPLPEEDEARAIASGSAPPADPDRMRYRALLQRGLKLAISMLSPRDRLRLACYYPQQLTLAQTGRVLGEHEATASRQLTRTRREIRQAVERHLKTDAGLGAAQIARCFEYALEDPGPLDLDDIVRKDVESDRSI
jgi:RNA polymerase sigma-70 factor, ECF subfamily